MPVLTPPDTYETRVSQRQAELQAAYDAATELRDATAISAANTLLSRIGTVDWKGEGYSSPQAQRDLSIKFHWGHNHRFTPDLSVEGRMRNRHVRLMAEFIEGFGLADTHLKDRSVLDIGCWTGGTTLMLKTMQAARILALEEVRKYADAAQVLTRDIYGYDDVTCSGLSLYELEEGQFDHVYFPGVIYHLSDPVLGLRRLYNRLCDGGDILVESAGIQHEDAMCWFKGNGRHFGGTESEMSRSGWAWFWPSAACLEAWMYEAGFEDVRCYWSPVSRRVFGHGVRRGWRDITRAGLAVRDIE